MAISYPPFLPIQPFTKPVHGTVTLPGSKSITNRALILAALGTKTVTLHGALFSRDTRIMVAALQALGFTVATDEKALTITITGRGGEIPNREAKIDVGNAGTAARFLTAFVCLRPDGVYHFDGDEAMRRRPIGALLEALAMQGAKASSPSFPFTLKTAGLPGGTVELDASESSQMLSALLMVAPHAKSPLKVKLKGAAGSKPFVAMTEAMLKQFAAQPTEYAIEGDASAASYFLALPLVLTGSLLIAFAFTAGYNRRNQFGPAVLYGVVLGFIVFVITEMADRAGSTGVLNPIFAALGPAIVAIVIGVTVLLRKEDGWS